MFFEKLRDFDSEVYASCERELKRQQHNIELIASGEYSVGGCFACGRQRSYK